jgi:hypothetical protein
MSIPTYSAEAGMLIFFSKYNQILARKELNFERMSDRDRKQIVAEVYVDALLRAVK